MRLITVLLALLLAGPALAEWKVAETANFRLYSTGSERDLVAQAAELEDYLALVRSVTGRESPPGPPLSIYMVRNPQEAGESSGAATWLGNYRADRGGILLFSRPRDMGRDRVRFSASHVRQLLVAYHELRAGGPVVFPSWFFHGLAEYLSTAELEPGRIELGRVNLNRAMALRQGEAWWLSAIDLITMSPSSLGSEEARSRYMSQSWLLTHYLLRTPEMQPHLMAYLRRVGRGEDVLSAWKAEPGLPDVALLNSVLQRYAQSRRMTFTRVARDPATSATVRVRELPPSAARLLLPMARLEVGGPEEWVGDAAAAVRAAAAGHPGDALAERALALADLRTGNREPARARIDRLLAAEPQDASLLRWRAESHDALASVAAMRAARIDFVAAFAADPEDWRTIAAYAQLFRPRERPVPQSVLDALERAYLQAPQVSPLAIDYGAALALAGRVEEAALVLRPVVFFGGPQGAGAMPLYHAVLARIRGEAGPNWPLPAPALHAQEPAQAR